MSIIQLKAENFKRLKAVELTPEPGVNVIAGKNGEGKSSLLDAIAAAIGGAGKLKDTPEPIRKGTEKSKLYVELDNLIINRTITASGPRLEVIAKDGSKISSPQKVLDELYGAISFDPLEFTRMKPKEQVKQLALAIGLDIDAFDKFYKELYDNRTELNRELKSIKARIDALPNEDVEEVNVSDILNQIKAANQSNQVIVEKERKLNDLAAKGKNVAEKIKALEEELEGAKAIYTTIKEEYTALAKEFKTLAPIDTTELEAKLSNATKINELAAQSKQRKDLEALYSVKSDEVQKINEKMHAAEEKKLKLLNDGKLPLKGLSFKDDKDDKNGIVTYKDIPLSQCSSAEQLKISFVIAMALNPKLKVILIRDGSLLDSGNMELISNMAETYGYQVWIEKVDESGKVGVVIEDGQIVKQNKKESANV